jgi:hypothetical protein
VPIKLAEWLDGLGHPRQVPPPDRVLDQSLVWREFALQCLLAQHGRDGAVHPEHLMIASHDLSRPSGAALVEQDEVLHQIQERCRCQHSVE